MTSPSPSRPDSPARLAARRFAQALTWTRLLEVTARVEAALPASGSLEDLLELEAGLIRAWPHQAGPLPVCEMFWTGETPGGSPRGLQLSAFDEAGRVLLRRTFDPWSEPARSLPERSLPERSLPERSLPERSHG
jgi:hypothetical protein